MKADLALRSDNKEVGYSPGSRLGDSYRVMALLGRGGMGDVYLVEQEGSGNMRAAKVMRVRSGTTPDHLRKFRQEALSMLRLGAHPFVVQAHEILRFSRLGRESLTIEHVHVSALVQSVVADLRATEDGREADIRIGPMPNVTADPALLKQVFTNLISNAVKFSSLNKPAIIEIGGWRESGHCAYSVRDNGIGFDVKKAEKLFDLFQRLPGTEQFEGNGVGLSITQRIVERHGGRIFAEAQTGKGARFTFTLPVAQEATGEST
jgi:light-regulated signal transduction histidine kinase (bacteriophytochrome)